MKTIKYPTSEKYRRKDALSLRVEVLFGMPGKDCRYHGICRIEPEKEDSSEGSTSASYQKAKAVVSLRPEGNLFFRFAKNSMLSSVFDRYFGSGYFVLLQDYAMPEFVGKALGAAVPVLRQGIYPALKKGRFLEVVFPAEGALPDFLENIKL